MRALDETDQIIVLSVAAGLIAAGAVWLVLAAVILM
jgi:hypothetical protein